LHHLFHLRNLGVKGRLLLLQGLEVNLVTAVLKENSVGAHETESGHHGTAVEVRWSLLLLRVWIIFLVSETATTSAMLWSTSQGKAHFRLGTRWMNSRTACNLKITKETWSFESWGPKASTSRFRAFSGHELCQNILVIFLQLRLLLVGLGTF